MFVQLNKCVVVCGSVLQRGHSGDGCLTSSILFKYERSKGHLFALSWGRVRRLWWWGLCQCLWCSLCCYMLFVSYVWVLFVVM